MVVHTRKGWLNVLYLKVHSLCFRSRSSSEDNLGHHKKSSHDRHKGHRRKSHVEGGHHKKSQEEEHRKAGPEHDLELKSFSVVGEKLADVSCFGIDPYYFQTLVSWRRGCLVRMPTEMCASANRWG